jgi:hypothetical protein
VYLLSHTIHLAEVPCNNFYPDGTLRVEKQGRIYFTPEGKIRFSLYGFSLLTSVTDKQVATTEGEKSVEKRNLTTNMWAPVQGDMPARQCALTTQWRHHTARHCPAVTREELKNKKAFPQRTSCGQGPQLAFLYPVIQM